VDGRTGLLNVRERATGTVGTVAISSTDPGISIEWTVPLQLLEPKVPAVRVSLALPP
jgi:hypothetical protein